MTVEVKGMSIREYLGQGEYWIDPKSGTVFQVSQMDPDRRLRAARGLARTSTALISLAEAQAEREGDLPTALHLAHQPPREWMIQTALYQALYPGSAGASQGESVNPDGARGVVPMYGVQRSA
jgi:hypothetical protein